MKRPGSPFPVVLAAVLVLIWLVLNQTLAPGQILLGAILAGLLIWGSLRLRPLRPRLARPALAALLLLRVLRDIIRSNISVARIVLGLVRDREIRSGFVTVPLDLRDPHGLAVLAAIVASTPGTVWVDLSPDGSRLILHLLDLRDPGEWVPWIKDRYERLLMRLFE